MKKYKVLKNIVDESGTLRSAGEIIAPAFSRSITDGWVKYGFIEEIPEEPKTVWDLKVGDFCYIRSSSDGGLVLPETPVYARTVIWNNGVQHQSLRSIGAVFLTEEDCKNSMSRDIAEQILLRDTKGYKPNWKECDYGVSVWWDVYDEKLNCNWSEYVDGTIRFRTEVDAETSIAIHRKEWLCYLGVEEG